MTSINFTAMTRKQLREYVKTHPKDKTAFHAYMDMLQSEPGIDIDSMDQFEQLVREKIKQSEAES